MLGLDYYSLPPPAQMTPTGKRQMLLHLEVDLLDAAISNGYVADYGEDAALRTIDNGVDLSWKRPFDEPVWYADKPYFQVGDKVKVLVRDRVVGRGHIRRFRENDHWEYELEERPNVWFAQNLLQQA